MHFKVEYVEGLTTAEIVTKVNCLESPHVILWYIGMHGLKKTGVEFYRRSLIAPIFSANRTATFWLVDLTAWGALKDPKVAITKYSSHAIKINNFISERVKCIKSSDIFNRMKSIENESIINYFQKALSRSFVWEASADMPNNHVSIKDLFQDNCPLLSKFYDFNTNKSYSMLQYLEGCLVVDEIVHNAFGAKDDKEIQIVFLLPNDEVKYYQDKENFFERDLKHLMQCLHGTSTNELRITVSFFFFKYGESIHHRPYNAQGKTLKKNELTAQLVVGESSIYPY